MAIRSTVLYSPRFVEADRRSYLDGKHNKLFFDVTQHAVDAENAAYVLLVIRYFTSRNRIQADKRVSQTWVADISRRVNARYRYREVF